MKKINICFREVMDYDMSTTGDDAIVFARSGGIAAMSSLFETYSGYVETYINDIYSRIDAMGANNVWYGSVYDAFRTKCYSYKEVLESYSALLQALSNQSSKICKETNTVANNLVAIWNRGSR